MLSQFLFPPSILNRSIAPSFMYFFAQLSNYSVRCGAEFPADICSIRFKALYFQVISDGRQYNFHLPRNLLPELLSETGTFSLSSSSSSSFVWYSSPCWDHRDHDAPPAPPPPRGQDPPGFSLRSWKIYLPKLRTVFNFKITCYESSTLDFVAPFRCLNAWRHIPLENRFWCLRVPKSIARGEPSPPFPALPSITAGGNLDWVPDLEGQF